MIEHIYFDLDNTLWDFRKNSYCALEKLYENLELESKFNIHFEDFYPVYSHYNELLWEQFRDHLISSEDLKRKRFTMTLEELNIPDASIADYFYENYLKTITDFNHLVEGSEEIIQYLKPKYSLHILSNGFQEVTQRKINNSALKDQFETITSAEEIEVRKPNPLIFEHALKKAATSKENSIFIGDDWIADALGARDFGMQTIFFESLEKGNPEEGIPIISKLEELRDLL